MNQLIRFSNSSTHFYFDSSFKKISECVDIKKVVMITDEHVFKAHAPLFKNYKTITIPAGEKFKQQATVDTIIKKLIALEADRQSVLIGVGGGVVTDITGYVAAVYMRGVQFGFVPTSILAIVDASIGGKNGIDVGAYKNLVGTIRQPSFILHDLTLLKTLPQDHWENGFAEIIKHACIKDAKMFAELNEHSLGYYQQNKKALADLIYRNTMIKIKVVQKDEFEKGDRKLLNFGHTFGHAIETKYKLLHGHAISIGMVFAAHLSAEYVGFKKVSEIVAIFQKYQLPISIKKINAKHVFDILKMDKKRNSNMMNFILLNRIGKASVLPIPLTELEKIITKDK